MFIIDSFEYVRPLNLEPDTSEEINSKINSLSGDRKGNIFFNEKNKIKIYNSKRYFNHNYF